MSLASTAAPAQTTEVDRGGSAQPRFAPVQVWAAVGALFLALETYVFAAWIVSGEATPTPTGPTPVPTSMQVAVRSFEVLSLVFFAAFVYVFVVRPWRREGRITLDGLFVIMFMTLYWQDPILNYSQFWFTYNGAFVNLGSWSSKIPGWLAPQGHRFVEPLILPVVYVWLFFGLAVFGCTVMRKAHQRWPRLSGFGLVMICLALLFSIDLLLEPPVVALGIESYPGAMKGLSIFPGTVGQFPLYESLLLGGWMTAYAALRYFRDDRGHTLAERGIDQVRTTPRRATLLRFLALVGIGNVIFIVTYNIPYQVFALHADTWPKQIQTRSYFTHGMCGPGTEYACSSPRVPVPRPNSAHLGPDGNLVVPPR